MMKCGRCFEYPTLVCLAVVAFGILGCQRNQSTRQTSSSMKLPFQDAVDSLTNGDFPPQHSLLIYQDDQLVLEKYWNGPDLVYGSPRDREFGPDELHGTRSCSKSVVSLLAGIAIGEEILPAVDTPAYKLFLDLALDKQATFTDAHRAITLEHLLKMRAGLEWNQEVHERELEASPDVAAYVWSRPMSPDHRPGEKFNYCSGATALLSRAIGRAYGKDVEKYAAEKLFAPLGIFEWEWLQDQDREPAGHFGLRLRPRDMIKIGRLVLQDGKWDGEQVVPASYMRALSNHDGRTQKYGYQWWLREFRVGKQVAPAIVAHGRGGQAIFVFPDQNSVAVLTAGHYNDNDAAAAGTTFVATKILPELMSRHAE